MKAHLATIHDNRNSFGGKAITTDELKENTISLISYDTVVAEYKADSKGKQEMKVNGYYSPTTGRHINEFLLQNGFNKLTKKEMEAKPLIKK